MTYQYSEDENGDNCAKYKYAKCSFTIFLEPTEDIRGNSNNKNEYEIGQDCADEKFKTNNDIMHFLPLTSRKFYGFS